MEKHVVAAKSISSFKARLDGRLKRAKNLISVLKTETDCHNPSGYTALTVAIILLLLLEKV
jgi:hypothetical protein